MKPEIIVHSHKDAFEADKVCAESLYANPELSIDYYHMMKGNSLQISFSNPDGSMDYESMNKEISFIVLSGSADFVVDAERYNASKGDVVNLSKASSFGIYSCIDNTCIICVAPLVNDKDADYVEILNDVHESEERDMYTKGHNDRVGKFAQMIMQVINPEYHSKDIFYIGATHDIGKKDIPMEILNKPGKLTDEEWVIMKKHPIYSYKILKDKLGITRASYARWHHERLDGTGYPDGLKGDEIPLESRIIAVADVFDAITSKRSYREKMNLDMALSILDDEVSKNHLDSRCVDALKSLLEDGSIDIAHEHDLTEKYLK